jgi:hypothetical protein
MNVLLVQGTWGDDDAWWQRGNNSFADAVVAAGHTLIHSRAFEWSTDLGGVGFGNRDLNTWRGAGRHLYDYCDPPRCPAAKIEDLVIIAHSHGRQVVKFACAYGLTVARVILVSGPIRKDVDAETTVARKNIGELICLNGDGWGDRMQWFGGVFDGHLGARRKDPEADINLTFPGASHSSMLCNPAQYNRVIPFIT